MEELEYIAPGDIEKKSFEIIKKELSDMGVELLPEHEDIIIRVIHTTADFDFVKTLYFSDGVVQKARELIKEGAAIQWGHCFIGFVVAAAVGLGAIKLINWLVKSDRFKIFAIYTLALGGVVLLISIIEAIKGSPITFA